MLDRTIAPPLQPIPPVALPMPAQEMINAAMPMFVLDGGTQPVVKVRFISQGGRGYEPRPGIANMTARMLKKGTPSKDATAIASYIDQYGATLESLATLDTFELHLTTLVQYLEPLLALVREILLTSTFPEEALKPLKTLEIQRIRLANKRNSQVAHRMLRSAIFGPQHPYGIPLQEADIERINRDELATYCSQQLYKRPMVFVSGPVQSSHLQSIAQYLKDILPPSRIAAALPPITPSLVPLEVSIPESLQASIAMGKQVCMQTHTDYPMLYITNELLGGFFGSRLMQNLREDKGYTYGVFSTLISLEKACYLYIGTDVVKEHAEDTCQEIKKEIILLQTKVVSEEELSILKNYLLGKLLRHMETPYSQIELFSHLHLQGLTPAYYTALYEHIYTLSPATIQLMAQTYLAQDTLHQVVVGV